LGKRQFLERNAISCYNVARTVVLFPQGFRSKGETTVKHIIVHFEIPADDLDRAQKFYGELLDWKITPADPSSEYYLIQTGEEGDLGGGMTKRMHPQQMPVNYIRVESVEEYSNTVVTLGGQVIVPKTAVPTMGYFAQCLDTEGNVFALWEDDPSAS